MWVDGDVLLVDVVSESVQTVSVPWVLYVCKFDVNLFSSRSLVTPLCLLEEGFRGGGWLNSKSYNLCSRFLVLQTSQLPRCFSTPDVRVEFLV